MSSIKVSILCQTFNHEVYIEDAIKGFLMQETDFDFEICIHDDASTDKTSEIIRNYESLFPEKIKPIYQSTNQYSLGKRITRINMARAQGQYFAICEGDDYWTDPRKLQKQVDWLDAHPETICVIHACMKENANFPSRRGSWIYSKVNRDLSLDEIISKRGLIASYSTYLYRRPEAEYPAFFYEYPIGDVTRLIFSAMHGSVHYMSDLMSVYRVGIRHSWSERIRLNNEKIVAHYTREINFYKNLDVYLEGRYKRTIDNVITKIELLRFIKMRDYAKIGQTIYRNEFKKQTLRFKLAYHCEKYFPRGFQVLKEFRYRNWV